MTFPTTQVLQALLDGRHHGFDIMDATDLPSGTVYPILRRLDAEGLVRSRWEPVAVAQDAQRPPRRYYELTTGGRAAARDAIARFARADTSRRKAPSRPVEA